MAGLRPKISRVTDLLIKSEPRVYSAFMGLCKVLANRDSNTKRMLENNKVDPDRWYNHLISKKVITDVYRRLGNYVINTARMLRNKEKPAKHRYVQKRMKKQSLAAAMTYSLKLSALFGQEALDAFEEYMDKLEDFERENVRSENNEYEMD